MPGLHNNGRPISLNSSLFKVPGSQDTPRRSKKLDNNSLSSCLNTINNKNHWEHKTPKIGEPGWRILSKTYDCIEKPGQTSPVLRLAEQARAISSPDPLHRPDNLRASLRSATTAQVIR